MFKGVYRLFDADITHSRVLFRCTEIKENGLVSNTDIIFHSVKYMDIFTSISDFSIQDADEEDIEFIKNKPILQVELNFLKVFVLKSKNYKNFIVAGFYTILENNLDVDQSSMHLS